MARQWVTARDGHERLSCRFQFLGYTISALQVSPSKEWEVTQPVVIFTQLELANSENAFEVEYQE